MFDAIYSLVWLHWHEVVKPFCKDCEKETAADFGCFTPGVEACEACPYYSEWKYRKEVIEEYVNL